MHYNANVFLLWCYINEWGQDTGLQYFCLHHCKLRSSPNLEPSEIIKAPFVYCVSSVKAFVSLFPGGIRLSHVVALPPLSLSGSLWEYFDQEGLLK